MFQKHSLLFQNISRHQSKLRSLAWQWSPQLGSGDLDLTYWSHLTDCLLTVFFLFTVSLLKTLPQSASPVGVLPAKQATAQFHSEVCPPSYLLSIELFSPSPQSKWFVSFYYDKTYLLCFRFMYALMSPSTGRGFQNVRDCPLPDPQCLAEGYIFSSWSKSDYWVFFKTSTISIYKNKTHTIMYIILT